MASTPSGLPFVIVDDNTRDIEKKTQTKVVLTSEAQQGLISVCCYKTYQLLPLRQAATANAIDYTPLPFQATLNGSRLLCQFLNQPDCNRQAKFLTWIRMLRLNTA